MSLGQNFPISEHYKGMVIDAVTIKRGGRWWTAALLIEDPRSKQPFINLYRWQETDSGWKTRGRFKITRREDATNVIDAISDFLENLL